MAVGCNPGRLGPRQRGGRLDVVARVERLDASQWARLRDVRLRALADAPGAFGGTLEDERARDERGWVEFLSFGPWWVAVDADGLDVGLVAGGTRHDRPWVFSMWVAPGHRGSGVAEALLDEVVAWATESGADALGLDVTQHAPRARRFYLRYGFVPTGVTEPLRRDPDTVLEELVFTLAPRR